jgi:small subunit ribosomal protein S4
MPLRSPRLKIIRRLGVQLPGLTRKDAGRKPYPPGQHGQSTSKRRKVSAFRRRLEEKQKIRFHYGVGERPLRKYMEHAGKMGGVKGHNLFALLERRLDNVVFRLGLAPTIPAARQLVSHGHVRVDGGKVDRPSYGVAIGETISLSRRARERPSIQESIASGPLVTLPGFLALDPSEPGTGRVIATPMRHDVPFVVDDAAVVEFYAR